MNLKEYRERPDEGLFGKIERRLRMRRALRVASAAVAGVTLLIVAGVWLTAPERSSEEKSGAKMAIAEVHETISVVPASPQFKEPEEKKSVELTERAIVASTPTPTATREEFKPQAEQEVQVFETPALPVEEDVRQVNDEVAEVIPEENRNVAVESKPLPNSKGGQPLPTKTHYDNILWAPNAIIPLSDDERNRQFRVVATSDITHFQLFVFNRAGRQVFATNDINQSWDATHNGTPLPQGTYVWIAKFSDTEGNLRQEKGTVTIIR